MVERFNDSQQQFFVRAIAMPGNNLDVKLFLSVTGADPPDLVNPYSATSSLRSAPRADTTSTPTSTDSPTIHTPSVDPSPAMPTPLNIMEERAFNVLTPDFVVVYINRAKTGRKWGKFTSFTSLELMTINTDRSYTKQSSKNQHK